MPKGFWVSLLFVAAICLPAQVIASETGYQLTLDYIRFAGELKQIKDTNIKNLANVQENGTHEILSEIISDYERIIRVLNIALEKFRGYDKGGFAFEEIDELVRNLSDTIETLLNINIAGQKKASEMLRALTKNDMDKFQDLHADFSIQSSKDTVTVEESYRLFFYFSAVILHALYEPSGETIRPTINRSQLEALKEEVLFYYGDEVKKGMITGQKHIDAVGAALWQGLSDIKPTN